MKPLTITRATGACAAAVLLAACASSGGGGSGSGSGPVTYGVLSCFTGRLASLGQAMIQGAKVAQSEINSAGGVLGRKVALVTGDTGCDVADGVTATNQMLTKNVSGIIGPETQEINGVEPILDSNKIVDEFQGGDTARDHQTDPYFFRDSPSDSQLGVAMALYAHQKGYTRAVMLFYSDPAAQTFLKPVSQTFTKLGGTILSTVIVTPDQTSYLSQVRQVINAHPQVIFTQEDPPTAAVLFREFKQLGGQAIPWIGTDVTSGSDYLKAIGYQTANAHLISVYGTSVTGDAANAFLNLFNTLYPSQKSAGPLANANYAYDAVVSLALADAYAKATKGTTIAHDMIKVTNPPGTACFTYGSCLKLIKAGTKINYEGASGSLDYNNYNNTFGPYGAFQASTSGIEQQVVVMSASALAAATP
ncbi:MAG TPA: ABC transporter substrate-binding protein [Streptosporangiaceae bacterium]|nr:ABC transporter substrate-binding protein [Streptosporangiaceae bacterium]